MLDSMGSARFEQHRALEVGWVSWWSISTGRQFGCTCIWVWLGCSSLSAWYWTQL